MKKVFCYGLVILVLMFSLITAIAIEEDVVYISDLEWESFFVNEDKTPFVDLNEYGDPIRIAGDTYEKGVTMHPLPDADAEIVYDISEYSGQYRYFYCVVGKDGCTEPAPESLTQCFVDGDGIELAGSDFLDFGKKHVFIVDISGVKELKLITTNGGDGHAWDTTSWGDAKLCNLSVESISIKQSPLKTEYNVGEELNTEGGILTVNFENELSSEVFIKPEMISGFDSSAAGNQTLTVTYSEKTASFDVTVNNVTPTLEVTQSPAPTATSTLKVVIDNDDNDNGILLLIAIGVSAAVVLAIVIIIVVTLRKRRKGK